MEEKETYNYPTYTTSSIEKILEIDKLTGSTNTDRSSEV